MKYKTPKGFTLIEVLVSLVLFSVGLLGVAFQFSSGIKNRVNNEVHSSVMQIVTQVVEPLNNSILLRAPGFKASLVHLVGDCYEGGDGSGTYHDVGGGGGGGGGNAPVFSTNNSSFDDFSVSICSASDSSALPIDLIDNDDFSTWLAPYTVVLMVTYTGKDGSKLEFPTTHVFVPPNDEL